jgi:2-polyprenyl-3-methyl-5-hydroxy-6-metoxy-1,4-benzoquinol methylase
MISTWSAGAADENMPEAFLAETLGKVRVHPWWQARARLALTALQKQGMAPPMTVADVGCGWGTNLDALEKAGYAATGFDISRRILEMIDRPGRILVEADLNQPLPAGHPKFDALLALDVIEHLDDDRGALARMAQLLKPAGVAIVSVPALPELFSEFDAIQGHRRRYLPDTLRGAFADTGLSVQDVFWWGAWMVPVLRHMRNRPAATAGTKKTYADYLKLPPWPIPNLMSLAYAWEHHRALKGRLKTGSSLFAVAIRNH